MEPGRYPVELLVRDDRKRESVAHAVLVVTDPDANSDIETLSLNDPAEPAKENHGGVNGNLHLHSSHTHRLQNMQIVFWLQNAQIGADTELQLDTGDGVVTDWSRKLRYGHRYQKLGAYTAQITSRSPDGTLQSNRVTVYIWPLWLPVIMLTLGLLLAGIPFFRRHQSLPPAPEPVHYQQQSDPGQQQLIVPSEEETPAIIINSHPDKAPITQNIMSPEPKDDQ